MSIHLFQENLRYDKVAEALGAHGEYVTRPEDFRAALKRCYDVAVKESRPSVINCQAKKEFWLRDQFPKKVELDEVHITDVRDGLESTTLSWLN
jgi:thiamine pyrophosphate-dependent acetolactate synthase large subunit-like protein